MRFDPDKAAQILQAVMMGMAPDRAALATGLRAYEHEEWIARGSGEEGSTALAEPALVEYVHALDVAVARAEMLALGRVIEGGPRADANRWLLERRFPEKWAKTPAEIRTAQLKDDQAPAEDAAPEGVVPEERMERLRREREERVRRAAGEST